LPSENDASDFSSSRFDPALEESEHLRAMFSDVNNVGLKRAGNSTLFVRGGKSRSRLKSVPTGFIVLDEVNEMPEENIPLVLERFSGQTIKQCMMISTPTVPKEGINKYYLASTMEKFFFDCPHCGKSMQLLFPDNIKITAEDITDKTLKDSYYFCTNCHGVLDHETKSDWLSTGRYIAEHPDRDNRGFNVNQMYSPTVQAWELAESYLKSLYDPTEEQEFFNSKLGTTHIVGDARVTRENIEDCKGTHAKGDPFTSPVITMGIDVGAKWHYEIDEWHTISENNATLDVNDMFKCRLMEEGEIDLHDGATEIPKLLRRYQVRGCIIDRHPETYVVYQISAKFPGLVYACMFGSSINGRRMSFSSEDEQLVTVNRTSWFDCALGRFFSGKICLPRNVSIAYQKQLQVPVRAYERDRLGNPVGRWLSGSGTDHFALARVYSEIALVVAIENMQPTTLEKVF